MTTTIPTLPPAPQRADGKPSYIEDADAFTAAMGPWGVAVQAVGNEAQAAAAAAAVSATLAVNAPGTQATSTTTMTIGQGAKTCTIQTGKALAADMWITVSAVGAPGNYMVGYLTSYTTGSGALSFVSVVANGAGDFSNWRIVLSPPIWFNPATKEQVWAGAASAVAIPPLVMAQALAWQPLTFATPFVPNGANFFNATTTVTSNFTLAAPVGLIPGQTYLIDFTVGGAGNFVMTVDTVAYKLIGGASPSISTTVGARDRAILTALTATTADLTWVKGR